MMKTISAGSMGLLLCLEQRKAVQPSQRELPPRWIMVGVSRLQVEAHAHGGQWVLVCICAGE